MTMQHPNGWRFGVKPRTQPARPYLKLANYRVKAAPAPPATYVWDWGSVAWGMHANDRLGDCVVAAAANRVEAFCFRSSSPVAISDADCLSVYSAACGYNPNDPSSDGGCDPTIVEQYLVSNGLAGHRIDAYASIDTSAGFDLLKDAVNWFGAVNLEIVIPSNMIWQAVWEAPAAGWTEAAGHEIELIGYDADNFYCVTWGYVQKVSPGFLQACLVLALAGVSKDMLNAQGLAFNGLDYNALLADLTGGNGIVPAPPPPPAPVQWWSTLSTVGKAGVIAAGGAILAVIAYLVGLI
jgi:hypothetical protein